MKILLIDYNGLFFRTTHHTFKQQMGYVQTVENPFNSQLKGSTRSWETFWRRRILNDLINIICHFKPDQVCICFDHFKKPVWRKSVYKGYKGSRSTKRDWTGINFTEYFMYSDRLIAELKSQLSNFKFLNVENCESDDIIATICKTRKKDEIVIFSNDGDFSQLVDGRVKLCHFNKKPEAPWIVEINEKINVDLKVLCGDPGDDIPNIFIMDGYEHTGKTNVGLGPKTAQDVLIHGVDSDFSVNKVKKKYPTLEDFVIKMNLRDNFMRNLTLISFNHIPIDLVENIKNEYDKQTSDKPYEPRVFQSYLISTRVWDKLEVPYDFHVNLRKIRN